MSIRFSTADSANLIATLNNNIAIANEIINRLARGANHLIASLDSGELQGAAYTAGRGLFAELIIPAIKQLQAAVDDIKIELTSYEYAHSVVAAYDTLDMDDLLEQLRIKERQIKEVQYKINNTQTFIDQVGPFFQAWSYTPFEKPYELEQTKARLEAEQHEINTKIEKLKWFVEDVNKYFTDSLEVLRFAIKGAVELNSITVDGLGNYYVPAHLSVDTLRAIAGLKIVTERSMTQMLQDVYGFSKETALDMQESMILMKIANMGESEEELTIKLMILFASVSYGGTDGMISDNFTYTMR
jgi:hypothetical protein